MRSGASAVSPTTRRGTTSLGIAREYHDAMPDEFRGGRTLRVYNSGLLARPLGRVTQRARCSTFNVMAMVTRCANAEKEGPGAGLQRTHVSQLPRSFLEVRALGFFVDGHVRPQVSPVLGAWTANVQPVTPCHYQKQPAKF